MGKVEDKRADFVDCYNLERSTQVERAKQVYKRNNLPILFYILYDRKGKNCWDIYKNVIDGLYLSRIKIVR
jgi:hypothetical protein